jgi:hypothetical protein
MIVAKKLVGTPRFELGTPCTPCKCATRLRHVPPKLLQSTVREVENPARGANDTRFLAGCSATFCREPQDPRARQRLQRRSTFMSSSSSVRTCRTICWLWVVSVRASSPPSLLRAPPIVKPWS